LDLLSLILVIAVGINSALATIGMTVPAVLCIGLITGNKIVLGLSPVDSLLLLVTLGVAVVTFSCTKTNIVHGVVHLILFVAYLVMIFD
jgi:Ca2+:H+ antiporter